MQILFRNDREEDCSTAELIAWDEAIIEEDREILESTDPDAIVDVSRKLEMHMPSDRPGVLMRRRLLALLTEQGEIEIPRAGARAVRGEVAVPGRRRITLVRRI